MRERDWNLSRVIAGKDMFSKLIMEMGFNIVRRSEDVGMEGARL